MGIRFGRVELTQHNLTVSPCEIEDTIGEVSVMVFFDHREHAFARFGDAGDDVDAGRFVWTDDDSVANSNGRVEHRIPRCHSAGPVHRHGVCNGSPTADEVRTCRFI